MDAINGLKSSRLEASVDVLDMIRDFMNDELACGSYAKQSKFFTDLIDYVVNHARIEIESRGSNAALPESFKAAVGRLLDASNEASELLDGCPDDDVASAGSLELSNAAAAVAEAMLTLTSGAVEPAGAPEAAPGR
jgi:hypothetical protein